MAADRPRKLTQALVTASGARFGRALGPLWGLAPDIHYLNHGAFGACPREVLGAQQRWRERIESQPTRFLVRELPGLLREVASCLGEALGTQGERIVFTDNATAGVNVVLRSIAWQPGDEVVLSRYAYPGVRNAVNHIAGKAGALVREAQVPFPLANAGQIVQAFAAALTPATRLAVCDHVSSATAVIHPVQALAELCRKQGVALLVDGAHAPGMLDVALDSLGCDWYAGNCHKWLSAPRGSGFLWAAPGREADLRPPVVSVGYGKGWLEEFAWQGTRDPTPWLSVSAALAFWQRLGWAAARGYMHELAREAADDLAATMGVERPAPAELCGAMVTLPLPGTEGAGQAQAEALHDLLLEEARIEVPVAAFDSRLWLRISAQVYNDPAQYRALAEALTGSHATVVGDGTRR